MGIKSIAMKLYAASKEREIVPIEHWPTLGNEFDGKTAWIAGGSGGIGLAIARSLLESGCRVIVSGINEAKLDKIEKDLHSNNLKTMILDYRDTSSFKRKCCEAEAVFNKDIDIFISAVGIHTDRDGLDFLNVTEEEYDTIMETNLKGTYFMCQNMAKRMVGGRGKHILILSSQSALEPAWSPYRLSKLGIEGTIKGMAQRLIGYGIIVNGIGPGPTATSMQKNYDGSNIYTPLNPIQRYTMPEEVAEVAKMLVSAFGDTIVGDTIYMSGGRGIIEIR